MKKHIITVLLLSLIIYCADEVTVFIEREPGSISGQILPKGVGATVKLYQGPLLQETVTDADGYFKFSSLPAGTYTLRANAPNYGTREYGRIQVEDGEGHDIGQFRLYEFPAPLGYISPVNGATGVRIQYSDRVIYLYFEEVMNLESLRNAFTINPAVYNLSINTDPSRSPYSSYHNYYVSGNFKLGTLYTFSIDTTSETETGEKLEFPYSSTFETEYFRVEYVSIPSLLDGNYYIPIQFNSEINAESLYDHLTIDPAIDLNIEGSIGRYALLYPLLSWIPDTTFTLRLSRDLQDIDGNYMQADTTFIMQSDRLKIDRTWPYHNQHFVPLYQEIRIDMNNIIDESTILNAVSIEPAVDFDLMTTVYSGTTDLYLIPDSLISNTVYKVTIDTSLRDYYGKPFSEIYTFSFVTK